MQPVPSADGSRVNWSNYKTGAKHIYFRLQAEKHMASVAIELANPSTDIQARQFAQLLRLKSMLGELTGEDWHWVADRRDENGKTISRIYMELAGVNVFNEADWPRIISFLKPRIIALDSFWYDVREMFV
jgi:hypothetical protein